MDFAFAEEQQAVSDVVEAVLADREFIGVVPAVGYDDGLWQSLAANGVLNLALPERLGGDGLGLSEVSVALRVLGKHGALTPALATLGFGVVPLVELASEDQQDRFLEGVGSGGILAAALDEPGSALPSSPSVSAVRDGSSLVLNGRKIGVLHAAEANWMLVTTDNGVVVVAPNAPGVTIARTPTASKAAEYAVTFADASVPAENLLVGTGPSSPTDKPRSVSRVNALALGAIGSYADGLVSGALRLTADHVSNRVQFGKPLATFQAVSQQLADVYVVSRTLNLGVTSAVWRLSAGLDATEDLDIVAFWLASEAQRVMQICHHLHGGLGVDITYPMNRYYSTIKDLSRLVGGSSERLDVLAAAQV
ncbi:acyl-CoA dehydrogenase family protein [Mycobacteroides salmoniphilum]|uniref:acyl-CoA dehydrogenase family protein n=1 Tax=Mycobacteroides salmoniphilum TaxID=404941 RepID=UPI001065C9E5|nr:acyl-CoA dehydrogenase family protein [Mycobacteroides salmoniphilum]TDZ80614.1 Acryloyl-CoA reductase (NADH) [Mycobacteroides salmoniphilum]TDZ88114.1 Acryloyl-CoA reductase (NADH) [Mycobacteroides salmoniphilum]